MPLITLTTCTDMFVVWWHLKDIFKGFFFFPQKEKSGKSVQDTFLSRLKTAPPKRRGKDWRYNELRGNHISCFFTTLSVLCLGERYLDYNPNSDFMSFIQSSMSQVQFNTQGYFFSSTVSIIVIFNLRYGYLEKRICSRFVYHVMVKHSNISS